MEKGSVNRKWLCIAFNYKCKVCPAACLGKGVHVCT